MGGRSKPITAAKAGSHAFTICAKETAPTADARTDPAWAKQAHIPIGIQLAISALVRLGAFLKPVPHMKTLHTIPTTN